jgi:hypothetical protein
LTYKHQQTHFLTRVSYAQAGVLPFGEALVSIPNTIVALCLSNQGLELVQTSRVMDCFVPIFTQKQ